jgi:hypothetical protein
MIPALSREVVSSLSVVGGPRSGSSKEGVLCSALV